VGHILSVERRSLAIPCPAGGFCHSLAKVFPELVSRDDSLIAADRLPPEGSQEKIGEGTMAVLDKLDRFLLAIGRGEGDSALAVVAAEEVQGEYRTGRAAAQGQSGGMAAVEKDEKPSRPDALESQMT